MGQHNCIIKQEIIILVSLRAIGRMEEVFIDGCKALIKKMILNNAICTKESLKMGGEKVKEHFGGLMDLNMLDNLRREIKLGMVSCIE